MNAARCRYFARLHRLSPAAARYQASRSCGPEMLALACRVRALTSIVRYGQSESPTHTGNDGATLLPSLRHFVRDWWFRGAAALLAGMTVGLVGGEATHSVRSLPWTILLIASSVAASAWVLRITTGARRRRDDRHEGLRRLREMGERLAIYDRETGLFAYWYFSLRLEEEVSRCARYGQTFSLLLLDARTGRWSPEDESALFQHMSVSLRNCDLVAHLGNLRFIVLLANTDATGAMMVKEHLAANQRLGGPTVGLASFPADGESCEALLTAAGASADDVEGAMRMTSSMRTDRQGLAGDGPDQTSTAA